MLIVFLIMLPVLALVALEIKNLLNAVIVLSAFSLVLSLIFYYLHAPDVAIAEAAIGSGFATVIFLIAIKKRGVLIMLTYPHSCFFYYDDKGQPVGFDYDIPESLEKFFEKFSQVITIAARESALTRMAHVCVPGLTFAEKDGLIVNFEGHLQAVTRPAVLRYAIALEIGYEGPTTRTAALERRLHQLGNPTDVPELQPKDD